jgi:hypothetical protein
VWARVSKALLRSTKSWASTTQPQPISAPTLSTWSTRHREEAFRIEIPDEEAEKFRTLGEIIDYTGLHEKPRGVESVATEEDWNEDPASLLGPPGSDGLQASVFSIVKNSRSHS